MNYTVKLRDHERAAQKLGNLEKTISAIRSGKGKGSDSFLIGVLGINESLFSQISDMLDNYPDWTDEDITADIIGV